MLLIGVGALAIASVGLYLLIKDANVAVFNPQGVIASRQQDLIIFATLLSMIVIVPVYVMLFVFAWKYRADNTKAKYTPEADHNKWIETVWWGVPVVIILILGVVTWNTSHELDPYKNLDSKTKPLTVKVVSLQWKWLFIYPEQSLATVNELRIPEKTPINLQLTADSPMNSFWVPNLGSQMYTMSGMVSELRLMANTTGQWRGSSTNISGEGYADMNFTVIAMKRDEFDVWASSVVTREGHTDLDWKGYEQLAQPSKLEKPAYYMLHDTNLFEEIVDQYMPRGTAPTDHHYIPNETDGGV